MELEGRAERQRLGREALRRLTTQSDDMVAIGTLCDYIERLEEENKLLEQLDGAVGDILGLLRAREQARRLEHENKMLWGALAGIEKALRKGLDRE